MDRRKFTLWRLALGLLVLGLALGVGLVLAQTQSGGQPAGDQQQKAVAQAAGDSTPATTREETATEKKAEEETPAEAAAPAESAAAADADQTAADVNAQVAAAKTASRALSGMRRITNEDRKAAAKRAAAKARSVGVGRVLPRAGGTPINAAGTINTVTVTTPHYFTAPNWAFTPIIPKFVDTLPGLGPSNASQHADGSTGGLGTYIPIAQPLSVAQCAAVGLNCDITGANQTDYYMIGLNDYTQKMHSSLGPTKLRGYNDMNPDPSASPYKAYAETPTVVNGKVVGNNHYMGPIIIAKEGRPTRVLFQNNLLTGAAGRLFIPMDDTAMGAGLGPLRNTTGRQTEEFAETRATMHLHGGNTPWISDGTPHQWITPAGELKKEVSGGLAVFGGTGGTTPTSYLKGVSFRNVPDMVGAGKSIPAPADNDGLGTYFWSNQQSNRLMFYHDHAWGTTRLNVYAGSAAGYLLYDTIEDAAIINGSTGDIPNNDGLDLTATGKLGLSGGIYHFGIPLVIQDKSFVDPTTIAATDPTWTEGPWGSTPGTATNGDLWFPHVYMPNQNPYDNSGANQFGRWDYGPWFWPPMIGQAAPTYGAVTNPYANGTTEPPMIPGTPNPSMVPEGFMDTPLVNGVAYPSLTLQPKAYRFRILNAANDRYFNLQLYYAVNNGVRNGLGSLAYQPTLWTPTGVAQTAAVGVCDGTDNANNLRSDCTEVGMVPAVPHAPALLSTKGTTTPAQIYLPACAAGVTNGVPGSLTAGAATTVPCWPEKWPTDGRDGGVPDPLTVGPPMVQIGTEGGWLYKPAIIDNQPVGYNYNRRDIVVLNVQDKSVYLGPAERADVIVDFSGVTPGSTLILYNDAPAPMPAFDTRLDFYTGDPDQSATGDNTGGAPATLAGYGPNTRTIMQIYIDPAGSADTNWAASHLANLTTTMQNAYGAGKEQAAPIVPQIAYGAGTDTFVRIQDTSIPLPGLLQPLPMNAKAIQELFTADYGRMNATLGTELPLTNFLTQTTIPLAFIDPPTEIVNDGETQVWKITHNGVDTHAVHFHLFNVQLINRVGWDGAIRPPDPNEVGWKETVRMNPLEDAIVALKPIKQAGLPFTMEDSSRPLDPSMPIGSTGQFTNIDPFTNNPITVTNEVTNFGWEYVWHCHLLGHEENDMMRPIVFKVASPVAPTNLKAVVGGTALAPTVTLTFSYTVGAVAPTSFIIRRQIAPNAFANLATVPYVIGKTSYSYVDNVSPATTYSYQVLATSTVTGTSSAPSPAVTVTTAALLATPTNLRVSFLASTSVILAWTAPSPITGVTGYVIERANNVNGQPGTFAQIGTSSTTSYRDARVATGTTYFYRVRAVGNGTTSNYATLQVNPALTVLQVNVP